MSKANNTEILPNLSSDSIPTKFEIKKLFSGLIVKRHIINFARVILSKYAASPLGVGDRPSRFNSSNHIRKSFSGMAMQVMYGAQTIVSA